jgi:hypothetical protein
MTPQSTSSHKLLIGIILLLASQSGCVAGQTLRTATRRTVLTLGALREEHPCKQPLILEPSSGETEMEAERAWLEDHHPAYGASIQGRWTKNRRTLDVVMFADANGRSLTVCFDVSAWFGY